MGFTYLLNIVLFSTLIFLPVFAERINFGGTRTYPPDVTLESSLPQYPKQQRYGDCHIQAAIVAVEAACFRKTNQKFSLSDAYFFYRHLRTEITNFGNASFLTDLKDGQFSQNDAGDYQITLDRIKNDNAMLGSEYNMIHFGDAIKGPLKTRAKYWQLRNSKKEPNEAEFETKMRAELATSLDESLQKVAHGKLVAENRGYGGYVHLVNKVANHPLQACEFSKLKTVDFTMTAERAVALITNAIPFICQTSIEGQGGEHVVLFAGYTYAPGYRENLSFKVRDSRLHYLLDSGWAPYCARATVVYNPTEEAVVLKSISL